MAEPIPAFPLSWPAGWPRANSREHAKFSKKTRGQQSYAFTADLSVADGVRRVLGELGRMSIRADDIVISTNVKPRLDGWPSSSEANPSDPGAAVYWLTRKRETRVMAIDRYYPARGQPCGHCSHAGRAARHRAPRRRADPRPRVYGLHGPSPARTDERARVAGDSRRRAVGARPRQGAGEVSEAVGGASPGSWGRTGRDGRDQLGVGAGATSPRHTSRFLSDEHSASDRLRRNGRASRDRP